MSDVEKAVARLQEAYGLIFNYVGKRMTEDANNKGIGSSGDYHELNDAQILVGCAIEELKPGTLARESLPKASQ